MIILICNPLKLFYPLFFFSRLLVYPEAGWHEHDPKSYAKTINECIEVCLKTFEEELGYKKEMICSVGIATQRETTILWDRETGEPIYNASEFRLPLDPRFLVSNSFFLFSIVVWADARNTSTVRDLREKAKGIKFKTPTGLVEGEEGVRAITGLPFRLVLPSKGR